ncbi:MAG: serine hydrolase [Candidatus Aminicenantales bacterium]
MKNKAKMRWSKVIFLWIGLIFLTSIVAGDSQTSSPSVDISQLDRYIESARQEWKIPGMAVAIVKEDRIVLAKGYGVKEFSKPDKVDEKTLFAIASNTKAFTAAALGILVDEGKISWDDRVRRYLPYFKLYDPYVTEEMRIRDLICHRSGLGTFSGDLLWYETPYSTEEVIRRAQYLKPAFGFRAGYGYSNIMFMAAGEIVAAVTGMKWKDFVAERIFTPLGMTSTNVGTTDLKKYENVATPHYVAPDGTTVTVNYTSSDAIDAAGAINSNAVDMVQWLILLLNKGSFNGNQILKEESLGEIWTPHNVLRLSRRTRELFPSTHFNTYGLGWGISDYQRYQLIGHSGALDGMISRVAVVPEIKLGLVILTNSMNSLPTALVYKIIDTFLGVEPKDWSQVYLELYRKSLLEETPQSEKLRAPGKRKEKKELVPKVNLEEYAGVYTDIMYGDAKVYIEKDKLVLEFLPAPVFISDLSSKQMDIFHLQLRNFFSFIPRGTGTVQFLRNMDGQVVTMKIDIPNNDFFFTELEFVKRPADRSRN